MCHFKLRKGHCGPLLVVSETYLKILLLIIIIFDNCIVSLGSLPWEIRVAFPGETFTVQLLEILLTNHHFTFDDKILPSKYQGLYGRDPITRNM